MRTTVDIPDALYRQLKARAALAQRSVRQLVLDAVSRELAEPVCKPGRVRRPLVRTGHARPLELDNAAIYELIGFP